MPHRLLQCLLVLTSATFVSTLGLAEDELKRASRHDRVAQRRDAVHIICHRGAAQFAHENTMEAYRAAFDWGADGNEIDVRATKDGVLVCFHDDMIDHLLVGYGDVSDYTWKTLQTIPFRNPGPFGDHCRIPTLREVLKLHRDRSGLVFLDVKRPGLSDQIADLLDDFDMWDHVVNSPRLLRDDRIKPTRFKVSLYHDRSEVFAKAIVDALKKPGLQVIVDDPRGAAHVMGRRIVAPSKQPYSPKLALWARTKRNERPLARLTEAELLAILRRHADNSNVPKSESKQESELAKLIVMRAQAADEIVRRKVRSPDVMAALDSQIENRSLHRNWRYCGLDGAAALRALISLKAPQAVDTARFCVWRDDPATEPFIFPGSKNARAWVDWRTKTNVFLQLERLPGEATELLCRDYLKLSSEKASTIGVPLFGPAARTLLATSPSEATVQELRKHRLREVRGQAILFCLARSDRAWARDVVNRALPGFYSSKD